MKRFFLFIFICILLSGCDFIYKETIKEDITAIKLDCYDLGYMVAKKNLDYNYYRDKIKGD